MSTESVLSSNPSAATPVSDGQRETLTGARVSSIIAAHPEALELLIHGGFPLLAQAPLRWAMAHTVNLGQAFRIANLDESQQEALLNSLTRLGVPMSLAGAHSAVGQVDEVLEATPPQQPAGSDRAHDPTGRR